MNTKYIHHIHPLLIRPRINLALGLSKMEADIPARTEPHCDTFACEETQDPENQSLIF
jgi:hypothetical protein